jgi:5-methylcytosine-specific restriction enzyme A
MSRREFSKAVRRAALDRANGQCEGSLDDGERCPCRLDRGKFHFDHDIPDWMGGEPTIDNCVVLCIPCHHDKTAGVDIPAIAKAKRIQDRERGIFGCKRKIESRGFDRSPPQRTASRPLERRS